MGDGRGGIADILGEIVRNKRGHASGGFITIKRRQLVSGISFILYSNSESAQRLLSWDGSDTNFTMKIDGETYNLNPYSMIITIVNEHTVKFDVEVINETNPQ